MPIAFDNGVDHRSDLIQPNVNARSTVSDIINHSYFLTGLHSLLNQIINMQQKDVGSMSTLLISAAPQLSSFPPRILALMVLPAICKACEANATLWVYALPLHVTISECIAASEGGNLEKYGTVAAPYVATGLNVTSPTETIQAFLSNVFFILSTFGSDFAQV